MTDDQNSTLPPAGWYADPQAPGTERFWSGTVWTPEVRQAGGAASAPDTSPGESVGAQPATGPAAEPAAGAPAARKPRRTVAIIIASAVAGLAVLVVLGIVAISWLVGAVGDVTSAGTSASSESSSESSVDLGAVDEDGRLVNADDPDAAVAAFTDNIAVTAGDRPIWAEAGEADQQAMRDQSTDICAGAAAGTAEYDYISYVAVTYVCPDQREAFLALGDPAELQFWDGMLLDGTVPADELSTAVQLCMIDIGTFWVIPGFEDNPKVAGPACSYVRALADDDIEFVAFYKSGESDDTRTARDDRLDGIMGQLGFEKSAAGKLAELGE